ncbi:hypothetical protein HY358_01665 [Candidatus Roizmanbacteria bacterium]|nr:hypothetical protein [Candidatus Roizmanbacteria bacterium]
MSPKQLKLIRDRLLNFKKMRFVLRKKMRYDDVGDYYGNKIISYDMKNEVINNAVMIHEFVEYALIKSAGLTPALIDKFDTDEEYEYRYPKEYKLYRRYHRMASWIERQFVENLGLDWKTHEQIINMTKVKTAVQKVTDELHKLHPSTRKLKRNKAIVQSELQGKNAA